MPVTYTSDLTPVLEVKQANQKGFDLTKLIKRMQSENYRTKNGANVISYLYAVVGAALSAILKIRHERTKGSTKSQFVLAGWVYKWADDVLVGKKYITATCERMETSSWGDTDGLDEVANEYVSAVVTVANGSLTAAIPGFEPVIRVANGVVEDAFVGLTN